MLKVQFKHLAFLAKCNLKYCTDPVEYNNSVKLLTTGVYDHLKKVYCRPYIQGLRVRLGYSPKGGTIRVNVSARKTKLAGSTIYQRQRHDCDFKTR